MQVVINISKEDVEYIKRYSNEEILPVGWREIIKGVPLREYRKDKKK